MASPGDFVVEAKQNLWYCMVCNSYFTSYDSVLDHVEEEDHSLSVQNIGNDILLIGPNHQYYCSICDRIISGYVNVYIHITGRKHRNCYLSMEEDMEENEEYEKEEDVENAEYEAYEECDEDQEFEEEY